MRPARWIDLGRCDPIDFHAGYAGIASAQPPDAPPVVVWGRPSGHICLGQSQDLAELAEAVDVPVLRRPLGGGTVWVDEHQLSYALIAPRPTVPRRHEDWHAWALAPAIAAYAAFGLAVERRAEDLWLAGRKLAGSGAATIGRSAIVASSFLLRFPASRFARAVAAPAAGYRARLATALSDAMTDWAAHGVVPPEEAVRAAFTRALRSELGWEVVASAPGRHELTEIASWRDELAEPIERGPRTRVPGGIKLNAELSLVADAEGVHLLRNGIRVPA